jgi:hypothetical protein
MSGRSQRTKVTPKNVLRLVVKEKRKRKEKIVDTVAA